MVLVAYKTRPIKTILSTVVKQEKGRHLTQSFEKALVVIFTLDRVSRTTRRTEKHLRGLSQSLKSTYWILDSNVDISRWIFICIYHRGIKKPGSINASRMLKAWLQQEIYSWITSGRPRISERWRQNGFHGFFNATGEGLILPKHPKTLC